MDEDARLIQRYADGDDCAVEELVMKYQKKIYALAYRMTGNIEDSKDVTQKTFLQAFRNIRGFRMDSAFYTWLYRIAVNTCLNHVRKKDPATVEINENLHAGKGSVLSAMIDREEKFHLRKTLLQLPERQKTAVILRVYEGLSVRETSEVMQCTEGAVKAHYHNGMKKIRELLKERGYGIES
ncbi:MAG: RNA polymerase sigma factor [Deferribacteres bacterium]|nr:RNA polymerase sigma factor [Deferribacteres bacterium]